VVEPCERFWRFAAMSLSGFAAMSLLGFAAMSSLPR
jgi:hypothetical protein